MPDSKRTQQEVNGKKLSIEEICTTTWETIYRYIYYKVQNREEAEDITQETYAKALAYLQKGEIQPEKQIGFLKTVALNILRDLWRKKQRRGSTADIDLFQPEAPVSTDHPEASAQRIVIEQALNQLNKEQQTVIELRILKGYSVAETARIMNKKDVTIRVMQHRALQLLANLLEITK